MSHYGPTIIRDGLVNCANGNYADDRKTGLPLGLTGYTRETDGTFLSDVIASGAGTAQLKINRADSALQTGSITIMFWINLMGIAIDNATSSAYRTLFSSSSSWTERPCSSIMEENRSIGFNTSIAGVQRRYVAQQFTHFTVPATGWTHCVFAYDSATGVGSIYQDNVLKRQGFMHTNTAGANPTGPGTHPLDYTDYAASGGIFFSGVVGTANPNGQGKLPGKLGDIHLYNRALSATEISNNFHAMKGRYGL